MCLSILGPQRTRTCLYDSGKASIGMLPFMISALVRYSFDAPYVVAMPISLHLHVLATPCLATKPELLPSAACITDSSIHAVYSNDAKALIHITASLCRAVYGSDGETAASSPHYAMYMYIETLPSALLFCFTLYILSFAFTNEWRTHESYMYVSEGSSTCECEPDHTRVTCSHALPYT